MHDERLRVRWVFGPAHARTSVAAVAERHLEALRELIEHCTSPQAGGYTPSDFSAAGVSQRDLDKLVARLRG